MSAGRGSPGAATRSDAMRRSFDEAFARPPAPAADPGIDLLALRIGGDPYAVRLADVAGLHVDLHIVPLPNAAPHLLGIAGIRGIMTPIYDLAGLLGYPPSASSRWVTLLRAALPVGVALEHFETHLRVAVTAVSRAEPGPGTDRTRAAGDVVQDGGLLRPILQLATLIHSIEEKRHDG